MMKLKNAAALALLGALAIGASPVDSRGLPNEWLYAGESAKGVKHFVKIIQCQEDICLFWDRDTAAGDYRSEVDCARMLKRWVNKDGSRDPWNNVTRGSMAEAKIEVVCR
jgi:hypothetical protein